MGSPHHLSLWLSSCYTPEKTPRRICQYLLLFIAGNLPWPAKTILNNHPSVGSAGIGRTGVVIAADIAMQQLDKEGEVDLLQILSSLRQDRGGMIQTKEQYIFLHQVKRID